MNLFKKNDFQRTIVYSIYTTYKSPTPFFIFNIQITETLLTFQKDCTLLYFLYFKSQLNLSFFFFLNRMILLIVLGISHKVKLNFWA